MVMVKGMDYLTHVPEAVEPGKVLAHNPVVPAAWDDDGRQTDTASARTSRRGTRH